MANSYILGIIGGGQLGKMLLQVCQQWSLKTHVLDPSPDAPCRDMCQQFMTGSLLDYQTVLDFGRMCDIVTYEIEHINIEALKKLVEEGIEVYPRPETLELIQNKHRQKMFFVNHGFPTAKFECFRDIRDFLSLDGNIFPNLSIDCSGNRHEKGIVWKKTTLGYDGYGVKIFNSTGQVHKLLSDLEIETEKVDNGYSVGVEAGEEFKGECLIEELVDVKMELSVVCCRSASGEESFYPPVEMIFGKESNQVEYVIAPARISPTLAKKATDLCQQLSRKIDHIGLLAVELFVTNGDELLINELAPRPHNSGHVSLGWCCPTSQFEQHLRAVLDFKLGRTDFLSPVIMTNLVGEPRYHGKARYLGLERLFEQEGGELYLYGKNETRPGRKMGHFNLVGYGDIEQGLALAKKLKECIRIIS